MKNLLTWIIYSSQNPEEYSLTIKGVLLSNMVIILAGIKFLFGVEIPQDQYVDLVIAIVGSLGALLTAVGLVRKAYNLIKASWSKK